MNDPVRSLLSRASAELRAGRPQSAEPLYRGVLAADPRNAEAEHFLGLALIQSGRLHESADAMLRSIALDPAQPMYALNAGLALSQAGRLDEAERVLRDAIAAAPQAAPLHNALAAVLQSRGAWRAARESLERAALLAPEDDTVQNNLGYALLECGEAGAAEQRLREALRLNPSNAMALNNLGNALLAQGDGAGAEAGYRGAIAIAPGFAGAHYNLGRLLLDEGRTGEALGALTASVRLSPRDPGPWQAFADALAGVRFAAPDPAMEGMLAECLRREDVEPVNLALAALSLLRTERAFEALLEADEPSWDEALRAARRPLFPLLLEAVVVPDARFERLVARLRRAALMRAERDRRAGAEETALACAVAQQCFLAGYPAQETAEEARALGGLDPGSASEFALAALAAYRPLAAPAAAPGSADFARLVRRQITEPAEERRLRATIVSLTGAEDGVSRAVREQYEEHPYPRWDRAPAFVGAYPLGAKLRRLFPHLAPGGLDVPDEPSVLIAGCGTGRHAAITARQYPNARILAVDLSAASLAFAMRRFAELGIANVRFARADLLQLGALQERFDLVECAGVLHHLAEPLAGWRALAGLLRPRGFMNVALYSEAGRAAVVAAKRLIAERGFPPTPDGMRAARAAILALPDGAPEPGVLESADFWSMPGCRDLLFHAMEHRFTPSRIDAALRELDLEFLGFELGAAVKRAYVGRFPGDPSGLDLAGWSAFEAERPATFAAMYQFWVRRRA